MRTLTHLFENNRNWAEGVERERPGFFTGLAEQQAPRILWIGCADSRVSANQITGLDPGEMFVHRNVANVIPHTDLNSLSVLQYAIEVLKVEHVIVCGHYGCGGVRAALNEQRLGLIDNWLLHVKDVWRKHRRALDALDDAARFRRLCELNVIEQVANVCRTSIVREAWRGGQTLSIHGWIYELSDGLLNDLGPTVAAAD
ncbi:MAG: carbonate dehydratase, partial [Bacteroidetes bacterium]|nr:carbonate dehydratase [Bacteroidota bacterium]